MGITKDEEQLMRTILIRAFYKQREVDRQFGILVDEIQLNIDSQARASLVAQRDALAKQDPEVIEDAITELRQELGEDAFNKISANRYQYAT